MRCTIHCSRNQINSHKPWLLPRGQCYQSPGEKKRCCSHRRPKRAQRRRGRLLPRPHWWHWRSRDLQCANSVICQHHFTRSTTRSWLETRHRPLRSRTGGCIRGRCPVTLQRRALDRPLKQVIRTEHSGNSDSHARHPEPSARQDQRPRWSLSRTNSPCIGSLTGKPSPTWFVVNGLSLKGLSAIAIKDVLLAVDLLQSVLARVH